MCIFTIEVTDFMVYSFSQINIGPIKILGHSKNT